MVENATPRLSSSADLSGDESSPRALALAGFGLAVLIAATVFAAIDRQILVLLADPIRKSLGLSDTQLGLLHGVGLALFGGVAAVPLGWLADRFGRRLVLAACVLLWSLATAACGLVSGYNGLMLAAIGIGIGEAALAPVVYSLIPEIVPAQRRALANGIYAVAAILGAGVGISLSGALIEYSQSVRPLLSSASQDMEPWRLAFLTVAVPGPVVAVLVLLIRLRPGARAVSETAKAQPSALIPYLRGNARTVASVFVGIGMANLGIAALGAWAPVIAVRSFGATPQTVGQGIGIGYIAGTVAGALVGGAGIRWLRPRLGQATPLRVIAIGLVLSAAVSAMLVVAKSALHVYLLFGLQVAFLISATVVIPTILQDMSPLSLRTRVIALATMVGVLLSASSPILVGLVSDLLHRPADGLALAVAGVAASSLLLGAGLIRSAERSFVRSIADVAAAEPPISDIRHPSSPTAGAVEPSLPMTVNDRLENS